MSRIPVGKVLLRNVIRHTDAHNKIQEETEMWKLRQVEKEMPQQRLSSEFRGQMHCDRVSSHSRDRSQERTSGYDEREARYWSRKLYEFEAADPDRWGHSGFKELYPEEFESDGEGGRHAKKNGHHKKKKSQSGVERTVSKHSKKTSRKKKRKKHKEERRKPEESGSDSTSDDSNASKSKQKRKRTKGKHKQKKAGRNRGGEEDSCSEERDSKDREKRTHSGKKRKSDTSGMLSPKRRRKNWKILNEENSDDSSGD